MNKPSKSLATFVIVTTLFAIALCATGFKIVELTKENTTLREARPDISISRVYIDSVDTTGKVYATEVYAGEAGSSGGTFYKLEFPPTYESKRWGQSKFYIPSDGEVFVLRSTYNGRRDTSLITPSW
jgi:hypothetical protein